MAGWLGPVLGFAGSLLGNRNKPQTTRTNFGQIRRDAEKAGFNPAFALSATGGAGNRTTSGGGSSFLSAAFSGLSQLVDELDPVLGATSRQQQKFGGFGTAPVAQRAAVPSAMPRMSAPMMITEEDAPNVRVGAKWEARPLRYDIAGNLIGDYDAETGLPTGGLPLRYPYRHPDLGMSPIDPEFYMDNDGVMTMPTIGGDMRHDWREQVPAEVMEAVGGEIAAEGTGGINLTLMGTDLLEEHFLEQRENVRPWWDNFTAPAHGSRGRPGTRR